MKKIILPAVAALAATPAAAASGPFFSLHNTDFVVTLGFLLFIAVLVYFKVPGMLAGLLDKRAEGIQDELDEARKLREEAQTLLASYERKQREVADQADRIVAHAKQEAELAAEQAKADIKASIERRLLAAEGQIASAEAAAIKDVRDRAAAVAIAAARDVVADQMTPANAGKLIDDAIAEVGNKLH
ncbi:F0F1 ATP synthase subunit B [Mameliella sediminis]|uniref:F0F1 ATP synthase subunit B n=1 Tax=Mameliella sediminis TaxID=2836866 RepID=UPI001C48A2F8|nr:F0F1 ATP synthase subunit B [Mameliella sediminis]MBY6113661.1 F0F1 ATP synthase subunit B [Antarctobacter heliothermus]MBY6142991.1 F0F1 ATP synthase subunit B [Mameliella alba]MBV7394958.1 F0F1 ATP synthase subunit B [Mameliella sediminis]MBY6159846.1 F0F1 ATP synthase subunit B [Mameliella alba]MBY6168317.1 F0F1 ATP synthase subunit B [Mameliella alba]